MPPRPLTTAASLALAGALLVGCSETETGPPSPGGSGAKAEQAAGAPGVAASRVTPPAGPTAEPVGDPIDPLAAAEADLKARKYDEAIAKIEAALKDRPTSREALYALAMAYQMKGESLLPDRKATNPLFLKSAEAGRRLRNGNKGLSPKEADLLSRVFYNEACSLAIDDKGDAAMTALKEAFDVGFDDMDLFATDPDLASLRKRPDFQDFQNGIGARKVARLFRDHKPFPFTFALKDIDDKPISLDDLKGKVVIVDMWGTWCPPCRKEIPHLIDLYKAYHDQGLEIVGLNYDETGPPDQVKKTIKTFLTENKVPYRCAVGDARTQDMVPEFEGYPTTLFLDRTGKVRLKVVGYQEKADLEAIVKTLMDEK